MSVDSDVVDASEHNVRTTCCTIKLTNGERGLEIPGVLRVRVEDGIYTWKMFLADYAAPDTSLEIGRAHV